MKYKIIASILMALLLLSPSVLLAAGPLTTTISDVIFNPNGTPYSGQIRISHEAFISPDGYQVQAGETTVNVIDGVLSTALVPNVNSFPMNTNNYYVADFLANPNGTEYWMVPNSSTPLAVAQVMIYPPLPTLPSTPSPLNVAQGGTGCTTASCIAGNLGLPTLGATNSFSALNTFPTVNVTSGYQVNGSPLASTNLSDSANLARLNGTIPFDILTGVPTTYYQTVASNGTAMTQRPTVNFSSSFAVTDSSSPAQTNVALAPTGVTAGTYTDATVTVNALGQVTSISQGAAAPLVEDVSAAGCNFGNDGPNFTCDTVVTLPTAMPDTNYSVNCSQNFSSANTVYTVVNYGWIAADNTTTTFTIWSIASGSSTDFGSGTYGITYVCTARHS